MTRVLFTLLLAGLSCMAFAQNYYPEVVSYNYNGTPTHGIKIKTNITFAHGVGMPTLMIEGYQYGDRLPIGIMLNWYPYSGVFVTSPKASSYGAYTPPITLSNENGKVAIFIDARTYYTRFTIRAFARNKGETPAMFSGWTVTDEPKGGTSQQLVVYENRFDGNVYLPGNGRWSSNGNVGIGTTNPGSYKLAVNGHIRAKEVKVETGWADFVFEDDYQLRTLGQVEQYIEENGHLPDVPAAEQVKAEGVSLGKMDALLLQKIEELTLYMIEQNKTIEAQQQQIKALQKALLNK